MEKKRDHEKERDHKSGENTGEGVREQKAKDPQENERPANPNWDQAQRRQQASPRSYNESLETQNLENQNTEFAREQKDREEKENDPKKIGDQISERQQSIDPKPESKQNKDKPSKGN